VSPFFEKKLRMHPNTKKSHLINALQGMAFPLKLDRNYYTRLTIAELNQEIINATAAKNSALPFPFTEKKQKIQ